MLFSRSIRMQDQASRVYPATLSVTPCCLGEHKLLSGELRSSVRRFAASRSSVSGVSSRFHPSATCLGVRAICQVRTQSVATHAKRITKANTKLGTGGGKHPKQIKTKKCCPRRTVKQNYCEFPQMCCHIHHRRYKSVAYIYT